MDSVNGRCCSCHLQPPLVPRTGTGTGSSRKGEEMENQILHYSGRLVTDYITREEL